MKYNKGDKVIAVQDTAVFNKGRIFTVEKDNGDNALILKEIGGPWYYRRFQLYEPLSGLSKEINELETMGDR